MKTEYEQKCADALERIHGPDWWVVYADERDVREYVMADEWQRQVLRARMEAAALTLMHTMLRAGIAAGVVFATE